MRFLLSSLILIALSVSCFGEETIRKVTLPSEVLLELSEVPDAIKGKVWNRWTSENFTVLSLNDTQAQYLHRHLELVKVWVFSRWGLYDVPFTAECRLICVDDPELFKKMFKIDETRVEIRREKNPTGPHTNSVHKIDKSVIFILINDNPSHTIPVPLTEVCLAEFALRYEQSEFSWWAVRGMSLLNGSLDQIRLSLKEFAPVVEQSQRVYFSDGLFEMNKQTYMALDDDKKRIYDNCAMVFCLMLRQEFGQKSFHLFLKGSVDGSDNEVVDILGFDGNDDFDRTFRRYMIDLIRDIKTNKTPDSYLQIQQAD